MIILKGKEGFEVILDPDRITAFGIDSPLPSLWVRVDGRDFIFTENVREQYAMLLAEFTKSSTKISGLGSVGE